MYYLLQSQVIAEVVMCLYSTFVVCFSIFLLVSITLVLEISKLLIECFHGNLTPLKWLATYLSAGRPLQSDMAQSQLQWRNLCCNPFNKPNHSRKKNQLRVVTKRICEKVPSILPGEKICDSCRKHLVAESEWQSLPQGHSDSFPLSDVVSPTDEMFGHPLATLAVANEIWMPSGKHLSPVQTRVVERTV